MIERVEWERLPAVLRAAVEHRTGAVAAAESIGQGLNSAAALRLTTAEGTYFLKGVRAQDADGTAGLAWEERVAPAVAAVSPALRLAVHLAQWHVLVVDYVPGRTVDLSHGSPDTEAVATLMQRLGELPESPADVPQFTDRYAAHLLPGDAELLHGEHLLHTDTNPHNILVADDVAHLVDWAMPALGPAWIDPALTAVRLMEDGQTAAAALDWLDRIPSWRQAPPAAAAAFVGVICRDWTARIGERAAEPSNARHRGLLARAIV